MSLRAWCCLLLLAALAALSLPLQAQPAAPATEPRFDILEFVVEGDTVLGSTAIERAVYAFLGPQRTAADAEGARRALEKAYQDAGFLSVSVVLPPQRVDTAGGAVRLQVVQAPVRRLSVTGAQYSLPSAVRAGVPDLAPGVVPDFNAMQQQLGRLARASADREITPIVAAGEQPGTMDVELKVQDQLPLHGSLELNDKQSPDTAAGRLEAGLSYDNLFQRGHSLGLNWFYSPRRPDEANIQSLSYGLPLGGPGDRLSLALTHSDSNTPTPLGGATVSRGDTWRLRWRDELRHLDGVDHALTWGLTLHRLRDRNRDVAGFDLESPDLRYTTFNVGYALDLSGAALGSQPGRSTQFSADLTISPSGLNSREVDCNGTRLDQFACKRADAGPRFQVLGLSLTHHEPFGRWVLSARAQGQFTDTPLVPAEQVVYGGQDSVRGYQEGEYAGDLGVAMRIELLAPAWQPAAGWTLHTLAFYDRALLRRLYALPTEAVSSHLASSGLGLSADTGFGLQASLAWSHTLGNSAREQRWDFSLRQAF